MKLSLKILFIAAGLVVMGCGGSGAGQSGVSQTTGWKYNDPKYGGFEVQDMHEPPTAPGMVFVPGGTFTMGAVAGDLTYDWNNKPRRVSVDSYYIDATEVRNVDWREYVYWLQTVFVSFPGLAQAALPDTLVWRKPLAYNEPLVEHYFRLPSFNDYPVVGVSWLQASEYCSWRTDRVNELALIRAGVLEFNVQEQKDANSFNTDAYLAGEYIGKVKRNLPDVSGRNPQGRRAGYEDGVLFPKFRLPTEAEWEYAAEAITADPNTGMYQKTAAWGGSRLRKPDGSEKGQLMANFQRGRGDRMGVAGGGDGGALTPVAVNSYWPNDFGLYCMEGNVNEWVMDVYRAMSSEDVEDARPFRGNVYTVVERNEAGRVVLDSLGRVKRDTLGYVKGRPNYTRGDNRNYRDGDMLSAINSQMDKEQRDSTANSNQMYYQGKGPLQEGMSTLVNEHSRVYKGGSFQDRAYWLSPGTRRFLDERMAKEDLGFRCAMDRLGAADFKKKR